MEITKFKDVAKKYKVIFFDAFGVLKNYNGLLPGVEKTFAYLKKHNIDFYLITNDASRSPEQLAQSYASLQVKEFTADKIISSGMLAREYLRLKVNTGRVAYLGTANSAHYLEDLGLRPISISSLGMENVSDVNALVLLDDEGFDWNKDINKAINLLRKRNIPVIVANTDDAYPVSRHEIAIAVGGIADMMESIVHKKFIRFGKPDSQMFHFAYENINTSKTLEKSDILMVGDTLHTDIIGGNKYGIDTALVLTGNTLEENLDVKIRSTGIIPDYICESVLMD